MKSKSLFFFVILIFFVGGTLIHAQPRSSRSQPREAAQTHQSTDDDWWKNIKIKQVEVKVFTETDDKDDNEAVTLTVKYGPFAAETTVGQGEKWPDQSDRAFVLNLKEPFPPASASFSLHVRKTPQGSPTGAGWHASFQITAITDGGARIPLGGRTQKFEIGDGHPYDFDAIVNAKAGG